MCSQIPKAELSDTLLHPDSTDPDDVSPDLTSEYQPSSSPLVESPTAGGRRVPTRAQAFCTPSDTQQQRSQSPDSSGSDVNTETRRKRGFSQVTSSPSAPPTSRPRNAPDSRGNQPRQHDAKFCTLRCLLGLQDGGALDDKCPNVELQRRSRKDTSHPSNAEHLVCSLKEQLDKDLDRNCTPSGRCGGSGVPFKLTSATYGYTVVGKGTTRGWWVAVAREADAYQISRKVQASAVPIVLGTIDLSKVYFLHGAGEIRHMLIMGW